MAPVSALSTVSQLAVDNHGAFRGRDAVSRGVARNQLTRLCALGVLRRVLPDTYAVSATRVCEAQLLRAALLWAGDGSAADGRSAGRLYEFEGVRAQLPEIVVARERSPRHDRVVTSTTRDPASLM